MCAGGGCICVYYYAYWIKCWRERSSVFDCVSRFGYVLGTVVHHDAAYGVSYVVRRVAVGESEGKEPQRLDVRMVCWPNTYICDVLCLLFCGVRRCAYAAS